jgi:hypothetical protein
MSTRYQPRSYSDTAPIVPERKRGGSGVLDPGARIAAPSVTEQQAADAVAYLTRTGNADLLPVLGGEVDGDLAVDCPTCSARAGSGCRQDGKAMKRPHVARRLAVDAAEHERQARAELDEETAGE